MDEKKIELSEDIDGEIKGCSKPSGVDSATQGVELSEDNDGNTMGFTNPSGVDSIPQSDIRPEALQVVSHNNPFYKMNHSKRGFTIIFKHETYDNPKIKPRDCATDDANKCEQTFTDMGFKVEVYDNLRKAEFHRILNNIRKREELNDCDSLVIVMMSHGSEELDENQQKQEYIMLRDDKVLTSTLWKSFTGEKCPQLAGKPKVFFIQACRGGNVDKGITLKKKRRWDHDGIDMTEREDYVIPLHSDMLIMWATYPGMVAFRTKQNEMSGSVFIHFLCQVLSSDHIREDLYSMLLTITRHVAIYYESSVPHCSRLNNVKQLPYTVSTLMRKVLFGQQPEAI